jgi:hypothetical protein
MAILSALGMHVDAHCAPWSGDDNVTDGASR